LKKDKDKAKKRGCQNTPHPPQLELIKLEKPCDSYYDFHFRVLERIQQIPSAPSGLVNSGLRV
jgi:hypothetical protein